MSGAGDGNRTHATNLEGWSSTIELHPHASPNHLVWWREKDLNLRTLTRADLQSAAIDHSATPPTKTTVLNRLIRCKVQ